MRVEKVSKENDHLTHCYFPQAGFSLAFMLNSIKRPSFTFLSKNHCIEVIMMKGWLFMTMPHILKKCCFQNARINLFYFSVNQGWSLNPAISTTAMSFLFKIFNPKKNSNAFWVRANMLQPLSLAKLKICGMSLAEITLYLSNHHIKFMQRCIYPRIWIQSHSQL